MNNYKWVVQEKSSAIKTVQEGQKTGLTSIRLGTSMEHSPIRQTFELGKFISTAGKSIINLVKL